MKKEFSIPKIEIISLSTETIIVTSTPFGKDGDVDETWTNFNK